MTKPCSFSESAIRYVLSYDFIYPSNVESRKIEAKSSLKKSIGNDNTIFNGNPNKSLWHLWGKPVRGTIRMVAVAAIGMTASQVGAVYNCLGAAGYAVVSLRGREEGNRDWVKAKDYAGAFFTDLLLAGLVIGWVFALHKTAQVNWYDTSFEAVNQMNIWGNLSFAGACYMPLLSLDPKMSVPYLAYRDARAPLFKSLSLKNEFGIVGQDGYLLPYSRKQDQEDLELSGHFADLMRAQAMDALFMIQDLQEKLPKGSKMPLIFPPEPDKIKAFLDETFHLETAEKEEWLAQFKRLYGNMKKMSAILKECLELKHEMIFAESRTSYVMPDFPYTSEFVNEFFAEHAVDLWKQTLAQTNAALVSETPANLPEEYKQFKERVKRDAPPHELLGVGHGCESQELRTVYKKCALLLHPDKLPMEHREQLYQECNALFNCAQDAFNHLKD